MMDPEEFTDSEKKKIQDCFDTKIKNVISGMVSRKDGNTYGVTLDFDPNYRIFKIQTNHDVAPLNGIAPDEEMGNMARKLLEKVKDIFNEDKIEYKDACCGGVYGNHINIKFVCPLT